MRSKIIILFTLFMCCMSVQEKKESKLIKDFIIKVNDGKVSSESILENFIQIEKDNENSFSLSDRKLSVIKIIEEIRDPKVKGNSLIPKYNFDSIKNFYIYPILS